MSWTSFTGKWCCDGPLRLLEVALLFGHPLENVVWAPPLVVRIVGSSFSFSGVVDPYAAAMHDTVTV